ncbi:hypothetical protein AA106555_1789 [Neokomagataea thailandica NBRC 106555]|uniref:Uncharacterized protein n=1 Tax=Neokomagataea thailandica NBRC 106555 TaxID=1223520 RepID=A0ABQ0QS02_9PROT|nr:plasmid recombination protein [Neokomagataea thailandica]GBR54714.1 hypothetical protein AA106555_1789 [Neokomagataea thailandica NBRC 106555]
MEREGIFSAVRCYNVKTIQALASAREHAFRRDENSKQRVDASRTHMNIVASDYGEDGRDVVDCFKNFKSETGIKEQKGASVALHMLCVVSPEWLQETGDPRDPNNPRVKELFRESQKWAELKFGPGSVICSRMDMDEAGSGVVDVFVCPSAVVGQKNRPGQDKRVISTRKALKNIQREYGRPRSFMALQDSFAEHCQSNLDPKIQRGIPKELSQREHVHADIYRPARQQADAMLQEANQDRVQASQMLETASVKSGEILENATQSGAEIVADAEKQKAKIYYDAKNKAVEDFADKSVFAKSLMAVDYKREAIRSEGKAEGSAETGKKAKRAIAGWKKKDQANQEKIQKITQERDELSESLKALRDESADISEPLRQARREIEEYQTLIECVFESLELSGIKPLKVIKSFDDLMIDMGKNAKRWVVELVNQYRRNKNHSNSYDFK